jgi:hypothetical protein
MKKKKTRKSAKKYMQVSGPGLYKRNLLVQEEPSVQQVYHWTSWFTLVATCYHLYAWQERSNGCKQPQEQRSFADANQPTKTIFIQPTFKTENLKKLAALPMLISIASQTATNITLP